MKQTVWRDEYLENGRRLELYTGQTVKFKRYGGRLKSFGKESNNTKLLFKKRFVVICRIEGKWVKQERKTTYEVTVKFVILIV